MSNGGDIVHLNVGGHRFSTSRQTLTVVPDTFFTALLSGRIPALQVWILNQIQKQINSDFGKALLEDANLSFFDAYFKTLLY